MAAMCSGVVPQQPPRIFTKPSAANSRSSREVTSGVSSKPVSLIGLGPSPVFDAAAAVSSGVGYLVGGLGAAGTSVDSIVAVQP